MSNRLIPARWEDYRDPAQTWQRPYLVAADHEEQALARLVPDALTSGLAGEINPAWLDEVLGRYYAAWPYAEYGLFLALCYAVREALADTVEFAIAFQASDRMRHLQASSTWCSTWPRHIRGSPT